MDPSLLDVCSFAVYMILSRSLQTVVLFFTVDGITIHIFVRGTSWQKEEFF